MWLRVKLNSLVSWQPLINNTLKDMVGKAANSSIMHFTKLFLHILYESHNLSLYQTVLKILQEKEKIPVYSIFDNFFYWYESNNLTLYQMIPTSSAFWKHCGKRRKCWLPAFSPFPTFSTLSKLKFTFTFSWLSSNALSLDQSKFCFFGKDVFYPAFRNKFQCLSCIYFFVFKCVQFGHV